MNFWEDKRFIEALEFALKSIPEEIVTKINDIAAMPASEVMELVDFAKQYAHLDVTKDEALVFLQDASRRLLSHLFAKRWRLYDGWLSAEECKRSLFLELDPLSIQMSMEFGRRFVPPRSGCEVND
ncbi:hypothetical protein [Rhizobium binae]|uniref:hypothetical protein n=1 Tax=Rhizobium binae TaxID=1138190 RepID=UPI001C83DB7A|nr:hypothetical protein [Rhizobium binae]MBX4962143.1 hypothetical protein [Rhizobium binae]